VNDIMQDYRFANFRLATILNLLAWFFPLEFACTEAENTLEPKDTTDAEVYRMGSFGKHTQAHDRRIYSK
jgi:hypothetical protein